MGVGMSTIKPIIKPGYGLGKCENKEHYNLYEQFKTDIQKWIYDRDVNAIKILMQKLITKDSVDWWLDNWKKFPLLLKFFNAEIILSRPISNILDSRLKATLYRDGKVIKEIEY